jgi:predicted dehydrogenase
MTKVRVIVIGCGSMARHHVEKRLSTNPNTQIVGIADPSAEARSQMLEIVQRAGLISLPAYATVQELLANHAQASDAAFIITPHAFHFEQAKLCLEAGLDVLLEKPMVITHQEAEELIRVRDQTGKLLVIAFNGSLSPQIRTASKMLRSGELGEVRMISASIWEGWKDNYRGHWKQDAKISGGGFMFDTGAHMMNTVADLANEEFVDVAAWLDNRDTEIDILGCVIGRLNSGVLVTLSSCGETLSIGSDIRIFCTKGIIRTGAWGEGLFVQRQRAKGVGQDIFEAVPVPASQGVWEQFLAVRNGEIENPSPPEVGLRMAKLWDAIQLSASKNGAVVHIA